jgi:hypothetical protein
LPGELADQEFRERLRERDARLESFRAFLAQSNRSLPTESMVPPVRINATRGSSAMVNVPFVEKSLSRSIEPSTYPMGYAISTALA